MRLRGPIFISLLAVGLLAAANFPRTSNVQKESVLIQVLIKQLTNRHYQPQNIDDQFSEKVYSYYIDQLDGDRTFFTQEDLDQLKVYQTQLDDEALAGNFDFFNLSLDLFAKALDKTQVYYREILAKPFDFSADQKLEMDGDKRAYAKNDEELRAFWNSYLKYYVLRNYVDKIEEQEKAAATEEHKTPEVLEKESRDEVLKLYDNFYDRLRRLRRSDRLSQYLNCITGVFDPHTTFFNPADKKTFDIDFSGRLEGIGARLQADGDYTKVSNIVVGGPAWKGKELEENDIILKVGQGDAEPVDIKGMQIDEAVQLIRGPKGTEVRLTVKKVDGSTQIIKIVRDVVIIDEQFAKSLIIDGKMPGEKIGYISLPSFYADFENEDGHNCSEDVAKEIEKLKAENVSGIILDLRNNGGGALREVVNMAGLFIEKGPIVQVKSRNMNPELWNDTDPRVQYEGPLAIMVNSLSASASEILVGAMQDYGRAVIIGGKSTFGKGTVQSFIDLDRTIPPTYNDIKPLGSVKITMQKFYRVSGGSNQLKGVVPDVILPDSYAYLEEGEREQKFPLDWSEIAPVAYSQNVVKLTNLPKIVAASEKRVKADVLFQRITENAKRLEKQSKETVYPLELQAFRGFLDQREAQAKAFKDLFKNPINVGLHNLPVDLPNLETDESKKARNEDWLKSLSKDVYLHESLNVMHDIINSKGLTKN